MKKAPEDGKNRILSLARLPIPPRRQQFIATTYELRLASTGIYYARVRVKGKLICRSLETDAWSPAKLRLADAIKGLS